MSEIPHVKKYDNPPEIKSMWIMWRKLVGSTDPNESISQVIKRYISEGKDVFTIPCPPFEDDGLKKIWVHSLRSVLKKHYMDETILEDKDRLARIRRRVEDRLRTGANSGLGELIIKLAKDLQINLN